MTGLGLADPAQEARLLARIVETISARLDLDEILQAMERFAERIVLAQEAERRRLAGEIHDGIS